MTRIPSPLTPTPSAQGYYGPKFSSILRLLRSVPKTIVSGALPSGPICSMMLGKYKH